MKASTILGVIGVALAGWLGYNNLYVPQQRQAQELAAQIEQEHANQRAQADVAAQLQRIERYRVRLAQEPDPSSLVRNVVSLAQTAGLQVTSLIQELPQQRDSATRLGVTLQFTASYHQVGAFVAALERSRNFIRIERVRITHSEEEGPVAIQMNLSTLHLPQLLPSSTPSAAAPPAQ